MARFLTTLKASLLTKLGQFLAEVSGTWPDFSKEVKPGQISNYVFGKFSRQTWPEIWPDVAIPGQISGFVKSKFTDYTWPNLARFLATLKANLLVNPGQIYLRK